MKKKGLNLNFKSFYLSYCDMAIDLGTSNILVLIKEKGIVLDEPSVVAIDKTRKEVIARGEEAREMLGRTPQRIKAVKPLKDGVIADFKATQALLKNIIGKLCKKYNIKKLRVVVGVPSGITEVERRAVEETIVQTGAKEVYLIEEPIAAAIGANMEISEPSGNIVVDIGGGTTEVAVISLGGIVVSNSIRIAGDELDEDILNYVKKEFNLLIGTTTAENIKIRIGCAKPPVTNETIEIRGLDLNTGLPRVQEISSYQVLEAISDSINEIVECVKITLEKTPPELSADVMRKGIILTGGGALIKDIDKLLSEKIEIPVYIAESPLSCVVNGAGKTLQDIKKLRESIRNRKRI